MAVGQTVKPNSTPTPATLVPKLSPLERILRSIQRSQNTDWRLQKLILPKNHGFPLPFLIVRVYSEGILPFPLRIHSENSVE